ncbi:hypothetical protein HDE_00486 [Halotydeus destructor]|nr:hypothetical protein HDE_00486 [Halotydeus destructor]
MSATKAFIAYFAQSRSTVWIGVEGQLYHAYHSLPSRGEFELKCVHVDQQGVQCCGSVRWLPFKSKCQVSLDHPSHEKIGFLQMRMLSENSILEQNPSSVGRVEMIFSEVKRRRMVDTLVDGERFQAPFRTAPLLEFKCSRYEVKCPMQFTLDLDTWTLTENGAHQHGQEVLTTTVTTQTDDSECSSEPPFDESLFDMNVLLECDKCTELKSLIGEIESLPESVRLNPLYVSFESALAGSTHLSLAKKLALKINFGRLCATQSNK